MNQPDRGEGRRVETTQPGEGPYPPPSTNTSKHALLLQSHYTCFRTNEIIPAGRCRFGTRAPGAFDDGERLMRS
jgi:hypothetical protein